METNDGYDTVKEPFLTRTTKLIHGEVATLQQFSNETQDIVEMVLHWFDAHGLWMTASVFSAETEVPDPSRFSFDFDVEASPFDQVKHEATVDVLRAAMNSGLYRETKAMMLALRYRESIGTLRRQKVDVIDSLSEKTRVELLLGAVGNWLQRLSLISTHETLLLEAGYLYDISPAVTREAISSLIALYITDQGDAPRTLDDLDIV